MSDATRFAAGLGVAVSVAWGLWLSACAAESALIVVDPAERHQTIVGWEAHHQSGAEQPGFLTYRDRLFELAIDSIGINRIRIEVWSGTEQPQDWYSEWRAGGVTYDEWKCHRWRTINDNDDPAVINWDGFRFTQLDHAVETVVLPLKKRLEERGERLYLNLTYTSFVGQCPGVEYIHHSPAEYAEFALAAFLHLRDRFGIVPDAWEMILEPDNSDWKGPMIGAALVQTGDLLKLHGFTPDFIAPSSANLARAIRDFDEVMAVPRVDEYLTEFAYHRYGGVSDDRLRAIGERRVRNGLRTAMLEHIGSGHAALHADLELASVSAWQQFALAYPTDDNGAQYVVIGADSTLRLGERTRYLQQYFRHVRAGAVRIGATSSSPRVRPLAFVHPDGRTVVVTSVERAATIRIDNLPPDTYGVMWTTRAATARERERIDLTEGSILETRVPASGVITIYAVR